MAAQRRILHKHLSRACRGVGRDVLARIENVLSVLVCIDR